MIMPFLRLVIIYVIVILGAVLFFKRDSVMPLLGITWGSNNTEVTAPAKVPAKVAAPVVVVPPVATPTVTTPQPETAQPPKYPTEQTAQITTATPAAPKAASSDDIQARLTEARQAYWNRDLTGAEARYKGLVNDAPDNADIKGELGNLYYTQRRYSEAAEYYHKAGLQLISDGNTQQVMGLIGVLQSIAPDKAADLRSRLSQ